MTDNLFPLKKKKLRNKTSSTTKTWFALRYSIKAQQINKFH